RAVLSLSEFHLAKTELLYLKALLQRLSVKEIAALYGVSDSTVRNTLARVYRKFEVPDMAALLAKLSEFDIID
ncbi:MAG: LuxR C-terminal-related transcriptional regulator, partial [Spirochaetales bacterium]|nr:LuxR C-terminal-related transcriptional regulator [Spirochaetales bacterium]